MSSKTDNTFLYEKLVAGVTHEQLTDDEKWVVAALDTQDYLYHTSYLTRFCRDVDGDVIFNRTPEGKIIIKANDQRALKLRLNIKG